MSVDRQSEACVCGGRIEGENWVLGEYDLGVCLGYYGVGVYML